jgi:hypothetical protein
MQTEVCRLSVCLQGNKRKLSVCKQTKHTKWTKRTCPSMPRRPMERVESIWIFYLLSFNLSIVYELPVAKLGYGK